MQAQHPTFPSGHENHPPSTCRLLLHIHPELRFRRTGDVDVGFNASPVGVMAMQLLFLATRLHAAGGALPPPRDIPKEQIEKWIADDEAGHRRFLAGA